MQETYVRRLLYDLSAKLGRKPQDMERFIKILEGQWYDSKEALAKLQPADYARLQIPERLASMISEAVGASRGNHMNEKMDIESPVDSFLANLNQSLNKKDFAEVVSSLSRIFNNIRENLINQKYRTLKKSNAKIAALTSVRQVVSILKYGGFQDVGSAFVMSKVNISQLDECIESIQKFDQSKKFNPFSESICSIGKTTIQNYQGSSSMQYNKMLEDLERERTKIMSQPIYDRKIKIYQVEQHNFKEFDRKFQEEREYEEESKLIELQYMKEVLKRQGEEPKFANRRMQEYNELAKKPVYSQTLIRVKLPENWVFECRFAPMETLQSLVDVFHDCLQNKNLDYYLYMTPPVEKLKGVILRKTFYELGCLPRAIFYLKTEQLIKGNLFRIKKSLF